MSNITQRQVIITEEVIRTGSPVKGDPNLITTTEEGKKIDQRMDQHLHYEFGGPWGVFAIMTGFPCLMYYLWICLKFNKGQLLYPTSLDEVLPLLYKCLGYVYVHAFPTWWAWKVYSGLIFFQLYLAWKVPGWQQFGLPVPSLGYKKLLYNCNALYSIYITMITAAILHYTGLFRLSEIIDNFGHLMTVGMIWGFAVSFGMYFITVAKGEQMRMSGSFLYDVFMGACLNPRIGPVDLKMWAEVRIPWMLVFFIAVSGACKQYDQYGYVTPNMAFMVLATWLYLNACGKGEECIPQTWDIYHEKWGFMVIFWNFAGVPFSYVYSILYMANNDPSNYRFSTPVYVALYATLLGAYYVWDTAMSQKSRFKMQNDGVKRLRKAFPQLPWGILKDPAYIQTKHGNRLLVDGWWAYSRKPNYVADWIMALCWGLCQGFCSPIPYFYSVFFIVVLIHRCGRDFERCSQKYGEDWEEYCKVVPYKFIPKVY